METFTPPRDFVENYRYLHDRREILEGLDLHVIDPPIVDLIENFSLVPECFTLQSCYGHFLHAPGQDSRNVERLPRTYEGQVVYRIAYVAFCLENSPRGWAFRESLESLLLLDTGYVQFGSADWFWERHHNSYVVQIEPARFMKKDEVVVEHAEALHIEEVRDRFFTGLNEVLRRHLGEHYIDEPGA